MDWISSFIFLYEMPQIQAPYLMSKVSWGTLVLVLVIYLSYRYLVPKLLEIQVIRKYLTSI